MLSRRDTHDVVQIPQLGPGFPILAQGLRGATGLGRIPPVIAVHLAGPEDLLAHDPVVDGGVVHAEVLDQLDVPGLASAKMGLLLLLL